MIELIQRLLGIGPKIIRRDMDNPKDNFSSTVKNINRMRLSKRSKQMTLLAVIGCVLGLCVVCGAVSSWYTGQNAVAQQPAQTPTSAATATLDPGWTPIPGTNGLTGMVSVKLATYTPRPTTPSPLPTPGQ